MPRRDLDYYLNYKARELEELCSALRRNDPKSTIVKFHNVEQGYGVALGPALQCNTLVTSLLLHVYYLIPRSSDGSYESIECLRPLFNYIATSVSLRKLALIGQLEQNSQNGNDMGRAFLQAMAKNPFIEELELFFLPSVLDLHDLISKSVSLKRLIFCPREDPTGSRYTTYSQAGQVLLAQAIEENCSIDNLVLHTGGTEDVTSKILAILPSRTLRVRLNELVIRGGGEDPTTVLSLLYAFLNSTTTLQHVGLQVMNLQPEEMKRLLESLVHDGAYYRFISIQKLSLIDSSDGDEALDELVQFLNLPTMDARGNAVIKSCLQELVLHDDVRDYGSSLAAVFPMQVDIRGSYVPTIGSQVHTMSLRILRYESQALFKSMVPLAPRIHLVRLRLPVLRPRDSRGLAQYL